MGNIIVWLAILGAFGWMAFNYFRIRKAAKFVDNATFEELIRKGQLIDLREPAEFHAKHILGARNIPYSQFKERFMELRKDQPIYLYEEGVSIAGRCAYRLKKNGYTNIYILKHGFEAWNGKVKKREN